MGELNTVPMRINGVEGAAGQVKVSGGPGVLETWVNMAAGGATLTVAETQVFAAAIAPVAFADLDINAVVGANHALVLFKLTTDNPSVFTFRINGDAEVTPNTTFSSNALNITSGEFAYVICATDGAGVVEWESQGAGRTTTVDVVAFIA